MLLFEKSFDNDLFDVTLGDKAVAHKQIIIIIRPLVRLQGLLIRKSENAPMLHKRNTPLKIGNQ